MGAGQEVSYISAKTTMSKETRSWVMGESIFMLLIFNTAVARRLVLSMGAAS